MIKFLSNATKFKNWPPPPTCSEAKAYFLAKSAVHNQNPWSVDYNITMVKKSKQGKQHRHCGHGCKSKRHDFLATSALQNATGERKTTIFRHAIVDTKRYDRNIIETYILYEKKIAIATTYTHIIIIKCSLYHYIMFSVSYRKKAFTTKACPYIILLLLCTAL